MIIFISWNINEKVYINLNKILGNNNHSIRTKSLNHIGLVAFQFLLLRYPSTYPQSYNPVRFHKERFTDIVRNFIRCFYRQRNNSRDTHFLLSFPAAAGIVLSRTRSVRTAQNIWLPSSVGYSLNEARRSHSPLYFEIRLPNQTLSYPFVSSFKLNFSGIVIFDAFTNLVFSVRFNNVLKN